jgi:hypothetical protein
MWVGGRVDVEAHPTGFITREAFQYYYRGYNGGGGGSFIESGYHLCLGRRTLRTWNCAVAVNPTGQERRACSCTGTSKKAPGTCTSDWHHQVRDSTVFCTWRTREHMQGTMKDGQGSSARAVLGRAKEKESVLERWPRSTDASLMPTRHLMETRIGSRGTPSGFLPIFPMLSHHLRTAAQLACSSPPTWRSGTAEYAVRHAGRAGLPCADQRDQDSAPITGSLATPRRSRGSRAKLVPFVPRGAHHSANIH